MAVRGPIGDSVRSSDVAVPPLMDLRASLPRIRQVEWDHYYMEIANTVASRANCTGSHVGAVMVSDNRIVSTGFNGTPAGFPNCESGGCVRCRDRQLDKAGRRSEMADRGLDRDHKHLDLCICVHAEANALLSAARYGIRTDGTTLYSTHQPCFTCLKETVQAGVARVVYLNEWWHGDSKALKQMYNQLAEHLRSNDERNFEQLHRQRDLLEGTSTTLRKPNLDRQIVSASDGVVPRAGPDGRTASQRRLKPSTSDVGQRRGVSAAG
jgi:dCMP deaminase